MNHLKEAAAVPPTAPVAQLQVNFASPAPGIFRVVFGAPPTAYIVDLPHHQAEDLFRKALSEVKRQQSGIVLASAVPGRGLG